MTEQETAIVRGRGRPKGTSKFTPDEVKEHARIAARERYQKIKENKQRAKEGQEPIPLIKRPVRTPEEKRAHALEYARNYQRKVHQELYTLRAAAAQPPEAPPLVESN